MHKDLVTLSMENNTYDINTAIEYCYVAANQINETNTCRISHPTMTVDQLVIVHE